MSGETLIVAGSHTPARQRVLRRLYSWQQGGTKFAAALRREPLNEHDENAVAVCIGLPDQTYPYDHIGYIPRPRAAVLALQMDSGAETTVARVRINRDWGGKRKWPMHVVKVELGVRLPVATRPADVPF